MADNKRFDIFNTEFGKQWINTPSAYPISQLDPQIKSKQELDKIKQEVDQFTQRVDVVLSQFKEIKCPSEISEELEIIERETREILFEYSYDDYDGLNNLYNYLQNQKKHLASIYNKQSPKRFYYEQISNLVVNSALFFIDENTTQFVSKYSNSSISYHSIYQNKKTTMYSKIWNVVKYLDGFEMSYKFKYDVYDKRRETLKKQCGYECVDTRTSKEKTQDNVVEAASDLGGCLIHALILGGGVIILAMIIGK